MINPDTKKLYSMLMPPIFAKLVDRLVYRLNLIRSLFKTILFDREFYLKKYPCVEAAGIDPLKHFLQFGKKEGKSGIPPPLKIKELKPLNPNFENILLVTPDAKNTKYARVIAGLSKELAKNFNIITFLCDEGDFQFLLEENSSILAGPYFEQSKQAGDMWYLVKQLHKTYNIKFALVNSRSCSSLLKPLSDNFIPSLFLIYDFFNFLLSKNELRDQFFWATTTIFPDKIIQKKYISDQTKNYLALNSHILPFITDYFDRAPFPPSPTHRATALYRLINYKKKKFNSFVIFYAGFLKSKRNIDLCLATLLEIKKINPNISIINIFAGKNLEPKYDFTFAEYLREQMEKFQINNFHFINNLTEFQAVSKVIDLSYFTFEIDPPPQITTTTLLQGIPILCFDKDSSICDFLKTDLEMKQCIVTVPFALNAANTIVKFHGNPDHLSGLSDKIKNLSRSRFSSEKYISKLTAIIEDSCKRVYQEQMDFQILVNSKDFNYPFYLSPYDRPCPKSAAIRMYIQSWHSRIRCRKPIPGFYPENYSEANFLTSNHNEPFAHYINSGKPQGSWRERIIQPPVKYIEKQELKTARVALHIHVFYTELLLPILNLIKQNNSSVDLLISTNNSNNKKIIGDLLSAQTRYNFLIKIVPNKGRDIGPFFTGFHEEVLKYDIVGHLHTKKSPHFNNQYAIQLWNNFLLENLIAGKYKMMDEILNNFSIDSNLGLVFPDDPHLFGWGKNQFFAKQLAKKMGIDQYLPQGNFNFPAGNMFWARTKALKPLFDFKLTWDDYPPEPIPLDGTLLHAIERILPAVVHSQNFTHAVTYVPDVLR